MERVIDCPCCKDSDSCFEEVQESFSSFMCFACGFMSDTRFEKDSLQTIENERAQYDGYSSRLDIEGAKTFHKDDFLSACKEMGITKDLKNEK